MAGGVVALGIAAVYIAGLVRIVWTSHLIGSKGHRFAFPILLLGLLAIVCIAIAWSLFRLGRAALSGGGKTRSRRV
jgi:hypothetical protein